MEPSPQDYNTFYDQFHANTTQIWSLSGMEYTIFIPQMFSFNFQKAVSIRRGVTRNHIQEDQVYLVPEPNENGNMNKEVVDLGRKEMLEQEKDFEELVSLHPVQSEDRMRVENLTDGLSLIEKGL
ncbi:hypothetical protein TNCV_2964971 [Trichonephila clavipes]|nr:hypothetical protein TNCV_2964971 [Trichonephila clavipes]